MQTELIIGVVEDVRTGHGQVKVRLFEYHSQDKALLKTRDLPWCQCLLPVTAANTGGIGSASIGLAVGSWVLGFFRDVPDNQDFVVTGSFAGGAGAYTQGVDSYAYGMTNATAGLAGGAGSGSEYDTGFYGPPLALPTGAPAGPAFINVARSQRGVKEVTNNQGPGIAKYWTKTSYPGGYNARQPWCAAFVSWIVAESGQVPQEDLPNTGGAFSYRSWASRYPKAQIRRNPKQVLAGDIVIFSFSHVGVATANSEGGYVKTIEGNTNAAGAREGNGVWEKNRRLSLISDAITVVS